MDLLLPGIFQTIIAAVLLVIAFRGHERYWTLGFLGWRKVYVGLVLYLISAGLNLWFQWSKAATSSEGTLVLWATALSGAIGIGLVLAGSTERLHDLARERQRLEEVRAGFDLFDSLREVISGPYSYLEILDYSLKEMVRGAEVSTGGLWLYNPAGREWVLTGAANMSQAFRQQTESIRGSGTGFERLARVHKSQVFNRPDEIRLFFPEWEAEGYRSIIGLPLVTVTPGQSERRMLGIMILADRNPDQFNTDHQRRLHAAADYVAAVVAEARLHREIDGWKRKIEAAQSDHEAQMAERTTQLQEAMRIHASDQQDWQEERDRLIASHEARIVEITADHQDEHRAAERQKQLDLAEHHEELNTLRMTEQAERARLREQLTAELVAEREKLVRSEALLENSRRALREQAEMIERERTDWHAQLEAFESRRSAEREEFNNQRASLIAERDALAVDIGQLHDQLKQLRRKYEDELGTLKRAFDTDRVRFEKKTKQIEEEFAKRSERLNAERKDERRLANEREKRLRDTLDDERRSWRETEETMQANIEELRSGMAHLHGDIERVRREAGDTLDAVTQSHSQQRAVLQQRARERETRLRDQHELLSGIGKAMASDDPVVMTLTALRHRLPEDTELFLWRRSNDARPEFIREYGGRGPSRVGPETALTPWTFESHTIPAEGMTLIRNEEALRHAFERDGDDRAAAWRAIWRDGKSPTWAVCWPWGSGPGRNGWITAFGFGTECPERHRVESLTPVVDILGALASRTEAIATTAPQIETLSNESITVEKQNLHDALIGWVADQSGDEWRLELTANAVPHVQPNVLGDILREGCNSLRTNGGSQGEEFSLTTHTENGLTTLRLYNSRAAVTADDRKRLNDDANAVVIDGLQSETHGGISGHWLEVDGRRMGLELIFPSSLEPSNSEMSTRSLSVLVCDEDESMNDLIVGMLETLGHHAVSVSGTTEAQTRLASDPVDAVIAKVGLSDSGDPESVLSLLKSQRPAVPLIAVTELGEGQQDKSGGADRILRRPFRLDQLQDCLESLTVLEPSTSVPDGEQSGQQSRIDAAMN